GGAVLDRDDEIRQPLERAELRRGEAFRGVRARRSRLGLRGHVVDFSCRDERSKTLPFLSSSARYSAVRHASATIVWVGFLSALLTNGAASATNRFFTSCDWQNLFSGLVCGSSPMRTVPTSWMIAPPREIGGRFESAGCAPDGAVVG